MSSQSFESQKLAIVIPSYRVRDHILNVLSGIGDQNAKIYVVDDACPEETGRFVEENLQDPRVHVLFHEKNQGVGAATLTGFGQAARDGADILVKMDGDGQMDPGLIPQIVDPVRSGRADYAKGNKFYDPSSLRQMPGIRIIGNAALSFLSKLSSGYWNIFDPTNGYVAIHRSVLELLPVEKISRRYFFESDMLFRLNLIRALVVDVPMRDRYGDEVSNMAVPRQIPIFLFKHLRNLMKRIVYNYYLRNFSVASVELVLGLGLMLFGSVFGIQQWVIHVRQDLLASSGTVMLAALPVIIGTQLLLSFVNYDVQSTPTHPISYGSTSQDD